MDSRNKRSIVLDLKKPEARAALDRLIAVSDMLICNFPPPVRDKLRLGYDDVKAVNPRLIYASLTGYGETGPDRDRPGFDVTAYFARSGLLDAQRYEGGPPGVPVPAQGDRATAMALVSAILMALIHRMKTGEGSWVGTSLLGNGLWSCGVIAQAALVGAFLPHRPPPDRPRSALGNIYRTSDDRWLQLTIVREDKMWPRRLRQAIERPDLLDDPRFATRDGAPPALGRARRHPERRPSPTGTTSTGARRWPRTASPSASSAGRRTCPTTSRPSPAAPWSRRRSPTCRAPSANPIRLGFAEQRVAQAAPALGQHSEEILRRGGPDGVRGGARCETSGAVR